MSMKVVIEAPTESEAIKILNHIYHGYEHRIIDIRGFDSNDIR